MDTIDLAGLSDSMSSIMSRLDSWVSGDCAVASRLEIEDLVRAINEQFESASEVDLRWHAVVMEGRIPHDEVMRERILGHYAFVLEAANRILQAVESMESSGCSIAGADAMKENIAECRGILTDDLDFFDDPRLIPKQDAAETEFLAGSTLPFEELDVQ